ncbi:UDP-glucose/GDP-mannose dehydrogenase family protein [Streptomyces cocklensis]|uniref:UDP-glucose 6-dehydrogenase n=1 Tax=Actinacidiphila cocklensis TaxID=887465 RepID=A0A9W4GRW8_9ACTN|nr:UDP-glucose/GDP-mannose dehydrogenase family protein [Actinacidiphila cocklensis]MDD1064071.1 UDP-glucose/GDP-mannose dehydrogenase family protein [Actinacidiphila cocklensis]CAG6395197.1 UDP-glucose 6-dehydrogenase [Actinacidiphila cocklensis]
MRLTVIGTGYLGATHAACMAELGHEVLGVDVDPDKIAALQSGSVPFYEPGLAELIAEHVASGRLRFTTSYRQAAAFAEVHFSCVGTPQLPDGQGADLRYVDAVIESLAPYLDRPALVVGKSTVPVGTAARLSGRLAELAPAGARVRLAWNPEFLREGFAIEDTLRPDRLVIGFDDGDSASEPLLREVYRPLLDAGVPLVVTDFPTAELAKTSANAFLATKISFINAMAEVCEAAGADVAQLSAALSYDTRIGGRFLHAGVGFGGGCLPKDIRAFRTRAEELGVGRALAFLDEVDAINLRRRDRVMELAAELLPGGLSGRRVAVWGCAFKPDSDDIRDSPALDLAGRLHQAGASVSVYDPHAMDNARKLRPELDYGTGPLESAQGAELILHLTEWRDFRELDPRAVAEVVARPQIVDGRNVLDRDGWRAAGWTFRSLGRQ